MGAGTWQSKLKLTRSIEQIHLVMIINKHATKYSLQVPSLSEKVERGRFLKLLFYVYQAIHTYVYCSLESNGIYFQRNKPLRSLMVKFMKGN